MPGHIRKSPALGAFLAAAWIAAAGFAQTPWRALATLPRGNSGFAAGIVGGRLLIVGGTDWHDGVKQWLNGIWEYDPTANHWRQSGSLAQPVAYGGFATVNGALYLLGGLNGQAAIDQILSFKTSTQFDPVGRLPAPRVYAGSAAVGQAVYLVGGSDTGDLNGQTPSLYRVEASTGRVQRLSDYPGGKITLAAVAAAGDHLYVFGGAREDSQTHSVINLDQAHVYDIRDNRWRAIHPFPHPRRGLSACALDDHWILVGGGYGPAAHQSSEQASDELYLYSIAEDRYVPIPPLPYAALGAVWVRDGPTLYLAGGEDRPRHRSNQLYSCRWSELIPHK
jgi:N-acetylneuraminic acid mutarotase